MQIGRWVGRGLLGGALVVGGLAGLAGTAAARQAASAAHEKSELTLDQLPKPVKSTFEKESADGGKVEELHHVTREGRKVYVGEIVRDGKGTDLEVAADGKVIKRAAPHEEANEPEHRNK